ncbi:MAG TPA: GAF domain-containing SpoIIE family protein phosphatase, partial [Candidatus Acidoferrum sp.]|nr:GAF domain-containing SpoIIE family protein phosphatase [Candidatus Acidoferrum sp.]
PEGLKVKVSWGVSEEFAKSLMYRDNMDLSTYCFSSKETIILSDLNLKSDDGISLNTVIALPIRTSEKCLGVMLIINKGNGGNYIVEDQEILERLLNFVAVAVDNSLLIKDKLKRQKVEQEMAIARQIQETILPQDLQKIHGAEIGAIYFPAREVGGDFYDIVKVSDDNFIVVLGDVSNKGVPAALVMSAASGIIKSIIKAQPDISVANLAASLNDILASEIIKDREMFVTLFFGRFDLAGKTLTFSNAGHLPGLYWENSSGEIVELAAGGPIVGQFPGAHFKEGRRDLAAGDRLFLFTDGLTEAVDAQDNLFGRERVEQVFANEIDLSPKEFCLKVKEWVDRFSQGASEDSRDDFTILQVKVD